MARSLGTALFRFAASGHLVLLLALVASPPAAAQVVQPVSGVVVDLHGSVAIYDQPGQVTGPLGVTADSLPRRGLGGAAGVHVYPFRFGGVTVGLGLSGLWTRGAATPTDTDGRPTGPAGETTLASLVPVLSFNFGTRDGWSYIGGGFGASTYTMRVRAAAEPSALPKVRTITFGAGARWFARPHLAFSFDVRWLALAAQTPAGDGGAPPKTTRMVASAGVSIR